MLELDKIKTSIDDRYFKKNKQENKGMYIGFNYNIADNKLYFEVSGKLFSTPTSFGAITSENISDIPEKIYNLSGIQIDKDYLIKCAPLYRIDIKKDILVDGNPENYISALREILKAKSDKFDVYKHTNLKYIDGLSVHSKKLSDKTRYTAYIKWREVCKDKNYKNIFAYDFIEKATNIIRFECQIRQYAKIREIFDIDRSCSPSIQDIFTCGRNVISDLFKELIV